MKLKLSLGQLEFVEFTQLQLDVTPRDKLRKL